MLFGITSIMAPFHLPKFTLQTIRHYNHAVRGLKKIEIYLNRDVTLYQNNDTKFFKYLSLCSISQFVFWTYLGNIAFTSMKDCPLTEEELALIEDPFGDTHVPLAHKKFVPLWRKINIGKYKDVIAGFSITIGFGAIILAFVYTTRSLHSVVLKQGGELVKLEFFSLLGKGRSKIVSLKDLSAVHGRQSSSSYLALKQRGNKLYYLLDMTGEFRNGELFDKTVGLKRAF